MEPAILTKTTLVPPSLLAMTSNTKTKVLSKLLSPTSVQFPLPSMHTWDLSNFTRKVSITTECAHLSDSIMVSSLLVTKTPQPNQVITTGSSRIHGVKNGETKDTFTWQKIRKMLVVLLLWPLIQLNKSVYFNFQNKFKIYCLVLVSFEKFNHGYMINIYSKYSAFKIFWAWPRPKAVWNYG